MAETNAGLGFAHAARGASLALAGDVRARHWRDAKTRFQDALAFWVEMRDKGATGGERDNPDGLAREIATCDAALVGLR